MWGGVLIRTHSRAGREKWAARFGLEALAFENFVFSGESGYQAQLGQKSNADHWRWLGDYFGLTEIELKQMRRDFFSGDALNVSLVEQVQRLRQAGYRTGLLSNFTDNARRLWTEDYPFIQYFDGVVISAEVGLVKPDPHIYLLAAERVGVQPPEGLFVDDFMENIGGARAVGMAAIHFTNPVTAEQELAALTGVS